MPSKNKGCIAITGANGFLGKSLVKYFSENGWEVKALVRQPLSDTHLVKYVKYDLTSEFDESILKGVDFVIHAAYIKDGAKHPNAFEENVRAAKNITIAAKHQNVKKLLFMSSMSSYKEAISSYGKQKLSIENIFSKCGGISIRSGLIIGNGGIVKHMINFMKTMHIVPVVDGGKQPLQVIDVDDLVLVIDNLLKSRISGVLTVASTEIYTYKELYNEIAKKLKIRMVFIPVPISILIMVVNLVSFLHLPLAINKDNILGLKMLHSVDTAKDIKKTGVKLRNLSEILDNHNFNN